MLGGEKMAKERRRGLPGACGTQGTDSDVLEKVWSWKGGGAPSSTYHPEAGGKGAGHNH